MYAMDLKFHISSQGCSFDACASFRWCRTGNCHGACLARQQGGRLVFWRRECPVVCLDWWLCNVNKIVSKQQQLVRALKKSEYSSARSADNFIDNGILKQYIEPQKFAVRSFCSLEVQVRRSSTCFEYSSTAPKSELESI